MRDFVSEVNSNPLPRELFGELVEVAIQALSGQRRQIPPDAERCLEDMPPNAICLTDIPENQMGLAIVAECRRRFPNEQGSKVSQSFLFRWFAITAARTSGDLGEFIRCGEDGMEEVHSAIFDAAAECPLNIEGDFDSSYVNRVRTIKAVGDATGETNENA